MFDPEKVSVIAPYCFNEHNQNLQAVLKHDYDQLLELYRASLCGMYDTKPDLDFPTQARPASHHPSLQPRQS